MIRARRCFIFFCSIVAVCFCLFRIQSMSLEQLLADEASSSAPTAAHDSKSQPALRQVESSPVKSAAEIFDVLPETHTSPTNMTEKLDTHSTVLPETHVGPTKVAENLREDLDMPSSGLLETPVTSTRMAEKLVVHPTASPKDRVSLTKSASVSVGNPAKAVSVRIPKNYYSPTNPALIKLDKSADHLDVDLTKCHPFHSRLNREEVNDKHAQKMWHVLSVEKTAQFLSQGGGIARFGDGEWKLQARVSGIINKGMEEGSKRLTHKLQQLPRIGNKSALSVHVGSSDIPFCIGMVPLFDKDELRKGSKAFYEFHMDWRQNFKKDHTGHYFPSGSYCSTSITRPDHRPDLPVEWWLSTWQGFTAGLRALFIGPEEIPNKSIVYKAIFACATEVAHVFVPVSKAFASHDRILAEIVRTWNDKHLQVALVTAGPLATVLAGELACLGIRAIDAGHIYKKIAQFFTGADGISSWYKCRATRST